MVDKTARLNVYVSRDAKKAYEAQAEKMGISLAEYVRHCCNLPLHGLRGQPPVTKQDPDSPWKAEWVDGFAEEMNVDRLTVLNQCAKIDEWSKQNKKQVKNRKLFLRNWLTKGLENGWISHKDPSNVWTPIGKGGTDQWEDFLQ